MAVIPSEKLKADEGMWLLWVVACGYPGWCTGRQIGMSASWVILNFTCSASLNEDNTSPSCSDMLWLWHAMDGLGAWQTVRHVMAATGESNT